MPDGFGFLRQGPPSHQNCRCMDVERSPIQAGDYVRYNGHIAQVTETRMSAQGEHVLTIRGGAIREMQVACDRAEHVPNWDQRAAVATIIADDLTDDGALPGETTEERVTRQREASARWVQGIRDNDPGAVYDVIHEGAPLEFTREGVEEWGRRQGDDITVEQELNRDHIDVIAHRDDFESVSRVSMFALHRARDPFLMLRVAAEAALGAVNGMRRSLRDTEEQVSRFAEVARSVGVSAADAVEGMGNMTRAMRQWEMQYTNRPGAVDGNTGYEVEQRTDAEYGEDDHDFEDERDW